MSGPLDSRGGTAGLVVALSIAWSSRRRHHGETSWPHPIGYEGHYSGRNPSTRESRLSATPGAIDPFTRLDDHPSLQGSAVTVVQKEKPPTSTRRPHRHRWVIPAGFVWAMSLLVWVLVDGVRPQSYQVEVVWLASMLTALGLMGTAAMSGELDVRTALARLKLGPWTGIGFSFGFGLATLSWLGDMQGYHGLVSPSSLGGWCFSCVVFACRQRG
jgi:hypothetical protein